MTRSQRSAKSLPTITKKLLALVTLMMVLALVPSTIQPRVALHPSNYGGTLVWGTINPPTMINPALTSHSVSSALLSLIFDPIVHMDENNQITPGLARSWVISDDGLHYTFSLRPGVYFHDGVECTSEDVKFTYDAIQKESNQSLWRSDTEIIKRIDVLDRYTVRLTLSKPYPNFLSKLIRGILPKHLYAGRPLNDNPHNFQPIGTGPFRLNKWDRQINEIILTANERYFEGRPFLDKIIVKTYEDNSGLWTALMRGEVDFVKFLNYRDYQILSKDPTFKTYRIPTGTYVAIVYNIHGELLSDRELRQAINYAIDRKGLMQGVGTDGVENNGPFLPGSPWFNANVEAPTYNPHLASRKLAARGWRLGSQGLFEKDGHPLVLTILVNRNRPDFNQMARVLRQQLAEVGIGLKVVFYDHENQLTSTYLEEVKPQMWLRILIGGVGDPSDVARVWYSGSREFARLWSYENKAYDRLFEQGLILKHHQRRADIYKKMHALIYEDQPTCFLFYFVTYHAMAAKVKNAERFFTSNMPDYLLKQWLIN